MAIRIIGILLLIGVLTIPSTRANDIFQHEIFNDDIKSVAIYPVGLPFQMPIIPLQSGIVVEFDDLGEYIRDLEYTIIHCNQDWTPSNINVYEYLDGFDDAPMNDFSSSRGTIVDYMHYRLVLPNQDVNWKISGNYILKIWDRDNNDEVLMHLRFIVFEPDLGLSEIELFRSTRSGFFDSHHEISFALGLKDVLLDDPMQSVRASVIQNYSWHSIQQLIPPRRYMRDQLYFDQHNSIVFPVKREYRLLDLRTLFSRGFRIHDIAAYVDGINVTLETDEIRGYEKKFGTDFDMNGGFAITNTDLLNNDWELEYVHVLFTLHFFNSPPEADVFVLGAFNNYEANADSRMEFDEESSLFYKEVLVKQGVYDYHYATKEDKGSLDFSITEGYDNRAENEYHIIIYYRPFHGTYDRVIAYGRA